MRYREELEQDHDFDLIVLSVQHDRLAEAASLLAPRVGNATVLVLSNIWGESRGHQRPDLNKTTLRDDMLGPTLLVTSQPPAHADFIDTARRP